MISSLRRLAPRTFAGRLALIAGIGLLVRLGHLFFVAADNPLSGDAAGYHLAANLFADGLGFPEPLRYFFGGVDTVLLQDGSTRVVETPIGHLEQSAAHPPLWTILLGIAAFLGATTILQQQVVSVLLGVPTIILMGLLGRELRSERLGLISASISAVYAFIWINDGLVVSETVAVTAATATMLAGIRFWREPSSLGAVAFGFIAGLAALSRAELVLFLPVVAAVILFKSPLPWQQRIHRYALCGLAALLVCMPWFIRNSVLFEAPVLFSNGAGTVLAQANCDETYNGPDLGYWQLQCGLPAPYGPNGELLNEYERDVVVRQRATQYISSNSERLLSVVVPARVGRIWGVYEPVGQLRRDVHADRRSFPISALGLAQYAFLAPTAIIGAFLVRRRKWPLLVLGAWIPIATITAATAFGTTRYRTAAETSLVILAAIALDALSERWTPLAPAVGSQPKPTNPHSVTEQPPSGSS